jgi:hypothetical protein
MIHRIDSRPVIISMETCWERRRRKKQAAFRRCLFTMFFFLVILAALAVVVKGRASEWNKGRSDVPSTTLGAHQSSD